MSEMTWVDWIGFCSLGLAIVVCLWAALTGVGVLFEFLASGLFFIAIAAIAIAAESDDAPSTHIPSRILGIAVFTTGVGGVVLFLIAPLLPVPYIGSAVFAIVSVSAAVALHATYSRAGERPPSPDVQEGDA